MVLLIVCVEGDGSLDIDGLEFGASGVSSSLASPRDRSNRVVSILALFFVLSAFGVAGVTSHWSGHV